MESRSLLFKSIGPGLVFAGAAIGASHLVQSTRAGASFGLSLLLVVVLANLVKYPAFSFGPHYAAATRTSLLEGYRRQGTWALILYAAVTLLSMFTVQAAVTFVTAGLAIALLQVEWNILYLSAAIMLACAALLRIGHYKWLDLVVKFAVVVLTLCTVVATALVLPKVDWSLPAWPSLQMLSGHKNQLFIAALIGWMPSAIDISVWHSLWTLARSKDTQHAPSVPSALLDFRIGYWGTALLGICFLLLGAGVAFGKGGLPAPPVAFSARIIGLYTENLGEWSRGLIGASAFLVMFSTTLTVIDGFPRALSTLIARFRSAESVGGDAGSRGLSYWLTAFLLFGGSLLILRQYLMHLGKLVDLATSISLVTAPVLAWLNHRAIVSDLEGGQRASRAMLRASAACIGIMAAMAFAYLYVRFLG